MSKNFKFITKTIIKIDKISFYDKFNLMIIN